MKALFSSTQLSFATAGFFSLSLAGAVYGGSFSADFSSIPSGANVYGSAFVDSIGGAGDNGGVLKLTTATQNQMGSFIIEDLDSGARIASFVASFDLRMGGGTTPPADGISFNFATDLPNAAFNELGAGTGLTITFDAFDNVTGDSPEAPSVRIYYGGTSHLIASRQLSTQLQTGTGFVPVVISYTPSGTITLVYNNIVLFTNLFVFGPTGGGARFGFGARTGDSDQDQFIDNLTITTTPINGFYVKGNATTSPSVSIPTDSAFNLSLQDDTQTVDPNSVTMIYNGSAVVPTVSKPSGVTSISYSPGTLLSNSVSHITVSFLVSGTPTTLQYDYSVVSGPLWSLAPGDRPYVTLSAASTPMERSLALSPFTNHLYIISRTGNNAGLSVNVVDSNTGVDLYQLKTNGIGPAATITLAFIAIADDGAIYAASIANTNGLTIYRWADDQPTTVPTIVFNDKPAPLVSGANRWGDSFAVRGSGASTELILDNFNTPTTAVLEWSDLSMTSFASTPYAHAYANINSLVGKSLQFGPTNTYFLKKKSATAATVIEPLKWLRYDAGGTVTELHSVNYYSHVALVNVDLSKNLAAGIFFSTNTSPTASPPDRLIVYDISNFDSPLPVAQYDFPVPQQTNSNFIGQMIFGKDKIFAVYGNNGIIAVPVGPVRVPSVQISHVGSSVTLSWTNTVPGFVLQSTPSLSPTTWNPVAQPVTANGFLNVVTETVGTGPRFYRLLK